MIFLTGDKGYIGGHLSKSFSNVLTLDENESFDVWKTLFTDMRDEISCVDTIIHCGAIANSLYDDVDIFHWNYETTKQIADFAMHNYIHMIFVSSCTAIEPKSLYGWSKRVAEDYIRANNDRYSILRLYNVYGEEDNRPSENHSVPEKLIRKTLRFVFNPFSRDYIHVSDIVRAIKHVQENETIGTYDVGTGQSIEVKELAELCDDKFYTECKATDIMQYDIPLDLCARSEYMIPDFQTEQDVYSYLKNGLDNQ